ncbi:zinc finger, CCHC-type containing protein [Tanacetum coccineum]
MAPKAASGKKPMAEKSPTSAKPVGNLVQFMSVVYVLTTSIHEDGDDATVEQLRKSVESSKELWDSLEAKYMAEDASSKKFFVSNFTNYKMTDSRLVMEHYNELFGILGRFTQHKMNMYEAIQVSCIIDKLPHSWKYFKHNLKHPKEELTLVELGSHLRIKESLGVQDSDKLKGNNVVGPSVVSMVDHNKSSKYNDNKGNKANGPGTKGLVDGSSNSLKGQNMFNKSLQILRFSSRKIVSLINVLHVHNIRKNLVSSSILNNCSYKQVIESNKFVLSKHGVCIGFGYSSNQKCRLYIVNDNIASAFMSTSKLNDSILWHARLGHFHFKRMQYMSKDGLILAFDMDSEKYKICMLTKITKKPFPNLKHETEVLELIHSDLCDLHATPSLGNTEYFVTFIDDALRTESRVLGKPNLNYLRVWGYRAVVRLLDPKLKTLGKRGIECIFVRYAEHSKALRLSLVPRPNLSIPKGTGDISGSVVPEKVIEEVVQQPKPKLRKSKRNKTPKDFGPKFQLYLIERTRDEVSDQHSYYFNVEDYPKTFDEAMKSQDYHKTTDCYGINSQSDYSSDGCKDSFLKWSLYVLNHVPKQWHQKFNEVVFSNGYLLHQADKRVYSKFDKSGKRVIICLYVDDMLIFGIDQVHVDLTKEFLSSKFSMKDIGEADVILVSTPMDTSEKLMPNNGQAVSQLEYSRVIGCLIYVTTCTRPDIGFAMGKLSRYTSNHGTQHWQAIHRVLKYLKKTMDYSLTYTGYPSVLEGYIDARWISNTEDNLYTSHWVFLLGGDVISWASNKQTCITSSTMESEFVALVAAVKEAEWLRNLILKIPLWSKLIVTISIRCDSAATLAKAYSQMYNGSLDT